MKEYFPSQELQKYFPFKIYHKYNLPNNMSEDEVRSLIEKKYNTKSNQYIKILNRFAENDKNIKNISKEIDNKNLRHLFFALMGIISRYLPEDII